MRGFAGALSAPVRVIGQAQVAIEVGVAPECPYGYYDVPPYACAPPEYYGPAWFVNGVFIGAGPWFRGPDNFRVA